MAYQLAVLVECADAEQCMLCKQFLDRTTRPLFPEDVPEEQLSLFEAIEEVDYPKRSMGSVRLGKVVYSSGWKSRTGKAGQPPVREPWAGGSNPKG